MRPSRRGVCPEDYTSVSRRVKLPLSRLLEYLRHTPREIGIMRKLVQNRPRLRTTSNTQCPLARKQSSALSGYSCRASTPNCRCSRRRNAICSRVNPCAATSACSSSDAASSPGSQTIALLPPPRKEMPHPAVLFRVHPLVVEASMRALRRRLQHHLAACAPASSPAIPPASPAHRPATAPPPSSAGSAPSARVPHSDRPPSPPGTRCPAPETPATAHSPAMSAARPLRNSSGSRS